MVQVTATDIGSADAGVFDADTIAEGGIGWDRTNKLLRIGDGTTKGGKRIGGGVEARDLPAPGTAVATSNTASGTNYAVSLPASFTANFDGAYVDFLVPTTSLGPVTLSVGTIPSRDVFMVRGQALRAGWTARFQRNDGGNKWNLVSQFAQGIEMLDIKDTTDNAAAAIAQMLGVPVAKPIAGDPNNFYVDFNGWANDAYFSAYIVSAPTAAGPIINLADGRRRDVKDCPVGSLIPGTIARFQVSFGYDGVGFKGSTAVPKLSASAGSRPDTWGVLDNTIFAPYGDVVQGGDGKPVFTPRNFTLVGTGSSVVTDPGSGRNGASPAGGAPVQFLADCLNEQFGAGLNTIPYNWSHGGHTANQGDSQIAEARQAGQYPTNMLLEGFGMNDMAPSAYNAGQQSPIYFGSSIYYEATLRARLTSNDVGVLVICTSPHTHTGRLTNTFGGNPMQWPYAKAAPVAAEELVPPFSQAVTPARDWTGSGIKRPGDRRGGHVNLMIRNVVRKIALDPVIGHRIILLDVEWAWFRYGVEVYSLDQLFNSGEVVHPNLLGHQVSYQRCVREFANACRRGRGSQWCFRGEGVV